MSKKVRGANAQHSKHTVCENVSTDGERIVFDFGNVDRDGRFCFDPHRPDFNAEVVLAELIGVSGQTWSQLKQATHNNGKSKHHFLSEDSLSTEAKSRINALGLRESTDSIFSLRLNGKMRVLGLRDHGKFIVKWYDPEHEFSKSNR